METTTERGIATRDVVDLWNQLGELIAVVEKPGAAGGPFARALEVLKQLSLREGIPIAIVGGLAAIKHGYKRLTHDIDVVVGSKHLDTITRVAPGYGIKVLWRDPRGWHKLQHESVRIEIVPEGGKPRNDAPTTIPGPDYLGVSQGTDYASIQGWMETKLASDRRLDQADVVQVVKKLEAPTIERIRAHLAGVHRRYQDRFEELVRAADEEKEQERERGGLR